MLKSNWRKYSDPLLWNLRIWFSPIFFKMFLVPHGEFSCPDMISMSRSKQYQREKETKKTKMRSKQLLQELRDWVYGGMHPQEAPVCCTESSQEQIHLNYGQSSFWLSQSVKTWEGCRGSTITAPHSVWTEESSAKAKADGTPPD